MKRGASEPAAEQTRAYTIQTATNSAMKTKKGNSTADARNHTTGMQNNTIARKNVKPIRVPTKKTATDTVPTTLNTVMCAAVSTDMCG